jgi:hypothetical protein
MPGHDDLLATFICAKIKKRARGPPYRKKSFPVGWVPGRSEAPPGLDGYFLAFLVFLAFFAFFAFFAFLAIASSLS